MTDNKLTPCPFCGSESLSIGDHRLRFSVSCDGCDVMMLGDIAPEPESDEECDQIDFDALRLTAINKWNTRNAKM